jgi:hypothetical protein
VEQSRSGTEHYFNGGKRFMVTFAAKAKKQFFLISINKQK